MRKDTNELQYKRPAFPAVGLSNAVRDEMKDTQWRETPSRDEDVYNYVDQKIWQRDYLDIDGA